MLASYHYKQGMFHLGHSKLNYCFTSRDGGDYGPDGWNIYVSRDYNEFNAISTVVTVLAWSLRMCDNCSVT